jgi:PAS domain S-box-containing protein
MSRPLTVLLVEDNPNDSELLLFELRRAGFAPSWQRVDTEEAYIACLNEGLDLILSDFAMPQFSGLRALELLKQKGLEVPFILVSGTIGEDTAVAAMKQGAADYLLKDRLARLAPAVSHALDQGRLRRDRLKAEEAIQRKQNELRVLFDLMPAMIWFKDTKNRILRVNQRVAQAAGKSIEEIEGKDALEIYPQNAAKFFADDMDLIESGTAKLGVVEMFQNLGGKEIWLQTDKVPVHDARGNVIGIFVMAQDITDRKLSELKIREQLAELIRWQNVMLNREDRVQALKAEVNVLLEEQNRPARYANPVVS